MDRIKSFKAFGDDWKVRFSTARTGPENWAICDHDEKTVFFNEMTPQSQFWPTLYHEVAHAAMRTSGLAWVVGPDVEEAVVRMFENMLLPITKNLHLMELKNDQ